MLEDVVQLLNQKSVTLIEKKVQLEQELQQVGEKIASLNYLIEVTKKLSENDIPRGLQENGFSLGRQL